MKQISAGVFTIEDKIAIVGSDEISTIKSALSESPLKRSRLCAHQGVDSKVHEMFIYLDQEGVIHPHKHLDYYESMYVIEGEVDVLLFTEDGKQNDIISLAPYGGNKPFFYRLPPNVFHTVVLKTKTALVHEIIQGPMNPERTVFAPWSPS